MELICGACHGRLLAESPGSAVACPHCGTFLEIPSDSTHEHAAPFFPGPDDAPAAGPDPAQDTVRLNEWEMTGPATNAAPPAEPFQEPSLAPLQTVPHAEFPSIAPAGGALTDSPAPPPVIEVSEAGSVVISLAGAAAPAAGDSLPPAGARPSDEIDLGSLGSAAAMEVPTGFPAAEPPPVNVVADLSGAAASPTALVALVPRHEQPFSIRAPDSIETSRQVSGAKPETAAGVSPLAFMLVVSYASAMTLACLGLAYLLSRQPSPLDLPDLSPPVKNKKTTTLMYLPPDKEIPAANVMALGESRQFGSVRVTPLRVTRGPVEFSFYDPQADESRHPEGPVLKLHLRFENVSQDQEFMPLDRRLVFTKEPDRKEYGLFKANNFVCKVGDRSRLASHVFVLDMSPDSEWLVKGQNLDRELGPGDSFETFIATSADQIDTLQGDLLWRVHFRKGYNRESFRGVTTLIEVLFRSSDIIDEEPAAARPVGKDAEREDHLPEKGDSLMTRHSRREFLEGSMLAATAAAMAGGSLVSRTAAAEEQSKSPNERLRVAILGLHGRGKDHLGGFIDRKDCEIAAICDPDELVGQRAAEDVGKKTGTKPQYYADLRKLFEDKSINIVTIATPNHWHSLAAIWAMQAGKDVYVEKPVSHNVSEGRRVVDTARKHGKICQAGTQSRSMAGTRKLMDFIHSGGIGEVKLARALCYKRRESIGPRGNYEVPASVNYDIWCGPAPMKPVTRRQFHYDWHWQWDYGNGDLGNQGIHQMDLARWGLGVADLGQGVVSYGGRLGYEDAGETANTQVSIHDYGDKTLVFEVRGLVTDAYKGAKVGVIFEGTDGFAVMGDYSGGAVFDPAGKMVWKFNEGGDHYGNFLKGVRSRKAEDLNGDILQGHLSSALCHLGNVSYRLGESVSVDEARQRLEHAKLKSECLETFERVKHHLADNRVDLQSARIQFGAPLTVDGKAETFMGDMSGKANPLLTREYRKGFEVPASAQLV